MYPREQDKKKEENGDKAMKKEKEEGGEVGGCKEKDIRGQGIRRGKRARSN